MATVTLKIEDNDDGTVNVLLESEPPIPGTANGDEMTPAQTSALLMLDRIANPEDITRTF